MSHKNLAQLSTEIDSAVHTNGPLGKTTAPGLSAVLRSLATKITILPSAYAGGVVEADSFDVLPIPGNPGKLYVVTGANALYRWSDNGYVALTAAPTPYALPPATTDALGGVRIGANLAGSGFRVGLPLLRPGQLGFRLRCGRIPTAIGGREPAARRRVVVSAQRCLSREDSRAYALT